MNWRRSMIGIGMGVPIIALLAYGLTRDPRNIPSPLPGKVAPEFKLAVMDAREAADSVALAAMRGDVVVINFWASWCLSCRAEHSDLSLAATTYAPKGVHFYGVLYNDTQDNARNWIREMGGQAYHTLVDNGSRTAIDYGLYAVPETFVIGRDGKVVHKQIGPVDFALLRSILDPLLAQPADRPVGASE
jgi:cytochrome c biogenesis protein CcmG, thiol:disulfide interchange protein DsbE